MTRRAGLPSKFRNGFTVDVAVACEDIGKASRRNFLANYSPVQAEREMIAKTLTSLPGRALT